MLAVQFQRRTTPTRVVKITAAQPYHACPDNHTMMEYKPGEFYEVPAHIAEGMVARQVAVPLGSDPAMLAQIPQAGGQPGEPGVEPPKPPPIPRDPSQEPSKPQHEPDEDEPEDDEDDNGEAAKKKSKGAKR